MTRTLDQILTSTFDNDDFMNTDRFFPKRSETLEQTGLHRFFPEDLACMILLAQLAVRPEDCRNARPAMKVIGKLLNMLKQRLILAYQNTGGFNVFYYVLTEQGRQKAKLAQEQGEVPCSSQFIRATESLVALGWRIKSAEELWYSSQLKIELIPDLGGGKMIYLLRRFLQAIYIKQEIRDVEYLRRLFKVAQHSICRVL